MNAEVVKNYQTIDDPTSLDLSDLMDINGRSSVEFDTIVPNKDGDYLKRGAQPYHLSGDVYLNHEKRVSNSDYETDHRDGGLVQYWFWFQFQNYLASSCELLKYEGAPFDTYQLEYVLKYNGIAGIIKIDGEYEIINIVLNQNPNINYARLPQKVKIMEGDDLFPLLKNKTLINGENIALVRNNLFQTNFYIMVRRYLWDLEKLLFYFEKNNAVSLPKAILMGDLNQADAIKKNWNNFLNSSETFNLWWSNNDMLNILRANGYKEPWMPINFEDKTRQLIENFQFVNEKIKEIFGFDTMNLNGKKERVLDQELNISNSLASYNLEHFLQIRNHDLKVFNQLFNHNVRVSRNEISTPLQKANEQTENSKGQE